MTARTFPLLPLAEALAALTVVRTMTVGEPLTVETWRVVMRAEHRLADELAKLCLRVPVEAGEGEGRMSESNHCPECGVNYGWHLIGCSRALDEAAATPSASSEPEPRMAFCPACFVEVTPEQEGQQVNAARVLAEFAKTAPGRLPSRVQEAVEFVAAHAPTKRSDATDAERYRFLRDGEYPEELLQQLGCPWRASFSCRRRHRRHPLRPEPTERRQQWPRRDREVDVSHRIPITRSDEPANEPSCPPCHGDCAEGDACKARRAPPVLALVLVALVAAVCVVAIVLGGPQ